MSIYLPRASISSLQYSSKAIAASSLRRTRGYATQESLEKAPRSPAPAPVGLPLNWSQYLDIRRSRRRWQTVAMFPSGLATFSSGVAYFASLEADPLKPIFGFDPFMVHGFLTIVCLGLGVLIGPTIGGSLWRMTHRHQVDLIDEKDREFLRRIAKNRVDPQLQSATSPVPDHYGEKIGSLHEYRQWLRDQARYRRKALLPEEEED